MAPRRTDRRDWQGEPFHLWMTRRRRELGLTQEDIRRQVVNPKTGKPFGVSTVSDWFSGTNLPLWNRLPQIAQALNTEPEEVQGRWQIQDERNNEVRREPEPIDERTPTEDLVEAVRSRRARANEIRQLLVAIDAAIDRAEGILRDEL